MSAEATLKKQAKLILAKNNWIKSIVGFLCVLSVLSLFFIILNIASIFLSKDIITNPIELAINIVFSILGLVIFILLSPVYTGYIKFISNCRNSETGNIQDVFYYFQKNKYFDTVQLNLLLAVKKISFLILFFLPAAIVLLCAEFMPNFKIAFQICAVWLILGGLVAYCLVSRLYILTEYLYVSDFNYRKEREITKASVYIVKKNYSKIISLYVSFILWGALCFFAIPVVFVYPYFKHTSILSYSYIYDLENNNPQSPYYHSNYPIKNNTSDDSGNLANNEYNSKENITDNNSKITESNNESLKALKENIDAVDDTVEEILEINNQFSQTNDSNSCTINKNFEHNEQTSENNFIPVENSDIIEKYNG